jgi:prepilin-type processing-associated H-X9-DG protein
MYKIIGADKAEYGPVTADTIREWIKQGRINSKTQVQPVGSTEWKPLSACAEFTDVLAAGAVAPPPLPSGAATPGQMSSMAIVSLVLGILGLVSFGLTALVGLVLGIVSLVKINNSRGALKGQGVALAGTIVSGFFLLMLPIFAAMLLPALARAKARAQSIVCMNNMKQLALGEMMYANDNKERFSSADTWCDAVGKYVPNQKTFLCPSGDPSQRCHYAFNSRLAGLGTREVAAPARTVLLFEIEGGWNASGGPELVLQRPRHDKRIGVVFADGHCEITSRFRNLRWEP